jgi:hypothetical protein
MGAADKRGKTALQYAREERKQMVVDMLHRRGITR